MAKRTRLVYIKEDQEYFNCPFCDEKLKAEGDHIKCNSCGNNISLIRTD
ncbi:MAG: hypothetical protein ACOCQA_01700 [bacterium]